MRRGLELLANAFPIWVLAACGLALVEPAWFVWFRGMQNSGLGVVQAQRHFPAEPLTAVPCAISSVVHSVIGSVLAGWWRMRP